MTETSAAPTATHELRPATADDGDLVFAITEDAMRAYVEEDWGRWDEEEQRAKHRDNFTPASHRIVLMDGAVAGLMAVEARPEGLWLAKLYLLAAFRGRGLGSTLLEELLVQARTTAQPVRLRVLRSNTRAQALYARHGFRITAQTPARIYMEWTAAGN